jgi:hypothetical protein
MHKDLLLQGVGKDLTNVYHRNGVCTNACHSFFGMQNMLTNNLFESIQSFFFIFAKKNKTETYRKFLGTALGF